ncbi:MAG: methyltransferase domain-containing protein [Rickettsiales bacterium]|nr:methyltransferase domain-containing protein [Rickettsiales bacterium]
MNIKQKIADEFSKYAESYNQNAILQKKVAENLANLIKAELSQNSKILDIGSGTGFIAEFLGEFNIIQSDFSFEMCNINKKFGKSIVADFDALPFQKNSFDFVTSSLALQWSLDIEKTFVEIQKIIIQNGVFVFSIFGQKTLQELKFCSEKLDIKSNNNFHSLEKIISALEKNNFEIISSKIENNIIEYKSLLAMLNSMKSIGAGVNLDESKKSLTKSQIKNIEKIYIENYSNKFPTTWEIYYIIAKKIL